MTDGSAPAGKIRVDKWLWHARFFKSRGLAGEIAVSGGLRVNGERVVKAAHAVRAGDVLTFAQAGHIRVIRVIGLGTRRGPATEARALYDDLDPPASRETSATQQARDPGEAAGRPDKRERREIMALRRRDP